MNITPLVGDSVEILVNDTDSLKGSIENILDRHNTLVRPPVSNIDQVVVVAAAASPSPDLFFIDKLIVCSSAQNIESIVCINKIDLDKEEKYKNIIDIYQKAGYKAVYTSCKKNINIEVLKEFLSDKISVFAGVSGVGKSSILNSIKPELELKTGEVSKKLKRGKHTTRHVELFELDNGGLVVDTPGFSSLNLNNIDKLKLQSYFKEFEKYIPYCKFRGCTHINEPGCQIINAVKDGEISKSRYKSYKQIYNIIKDIKEWEK